MAKKITEKQKKEIIKDFLNSKTLDEISAKYDFTKLTITRHLKKNIGDKKYNQLINPTKLVNEFCNKDSSLNQEHDNNYESFQSSSLESFSENTFLEIPLLEVEIDKDSQKDLSSISISEVDLPKVVYMIVDKNIELEPKLLKEYPEWSFLSEKDLNRKTIEIYFDLKIAKRSCSKEQKVIKVPDSNVFKITAPILISQGISRIVSSQLLIAL